MKNMKISTKLLLGFLSVLVLTIVVGIAGWTGLKGVNDKVTKSETMGRIVTGILEARREEKNYIIRKNEESIKKQAIAVQKILAEANQIKNSFTNVSDKSQIDSLITNINEYQNAFLTYLQTENKKNEAMDKMRASAREALANLQDLMNNHQSNNAIASQTVINFLMARKAEKEYIISSEEKWLTEQRTMISEALNRIEKLNNREAEDIITEIKNYRSNYEQFIALTNQQQEMDKTLVSTARHAIEICYSCKTSQQQKMETQMEASILLIVFFIVLAIILSLIITFTITSMIANPVKQGVAFAQRIANGDLTAVVSLDQKDEIGQLVNALKLMAEKIKQIVTEVQEGATQIASASQEISSASQIMSQGATEQAASLEEISSSMEEMVANIRQNADNAQQTQKIAIETVKAVNEGSNSTIQSLQAMQNIAGKILIINEIASQTNILALNAAVEAARAGEAGKGFAVVAVEVRKLAEMSRMAADEISILSRNGVDISKKSGDQLSGLIPQIEKTAHLVQEIAAGSQEQDTGADQINNAIQQLNMVSQQNASSSEEMAANSEELASQALSLQQIISYFKTNQHTQVNTEKQKKSAAGIKNESHKQSNKIKIKGAIDKTTSTQVSSRLISENPEMKQVKKGYSIKFESDENYDKNFQSF